MPYFSAALATLFLCLSSQSAEAVGGSIIVDQSGNPQSLVGIWTLTAPNRQMTTNARTQITKAIDNPKTGLYTFAVRSPSGAETAIRLYQGSNLIHTENGDRVQFNYTEGAMLRIHIQFAFHGVVRVASTPPGVAFELKGPDNMRFTGRTPAEFTAMPPVYYTVRYSNVEGCIPAKPQRRNLSEGNPLQFQNDFLCGIAVATPTPPIPLTPVDGGIIVRQNLTQYEVLPGGRIRATVTVENTSRSTVHDLMLRTEYNPAQVNVLQSLPRGGYVMGNQIYWNLPDILAGQSWSTTYEMEVRENAAMGDAVTMTTWVSGVEINPFARNVLQDADSVAVTELPQTGVTPDMLFLGGSLIGCLALTRKIRLKKSDVAPIA